MAALPYIQLYVADYLADTMHLTCEEHGAYLLIIMNYWQTGKPVKKSKLPSITKLSNDRWNSVELTLNEFFTEPEQGYWYHARIEGDLNRVKSKSIQASKAGKLSAAKRAQSKAIDNKEVSNGRSNSVQRKSNHTDTDTDTDTDKRIIDKSFQLNKTNSDWLTDYEISDEIRKEIIRDFVDYWYLDGSKKTDRGWQSAFRKNPVVKRKLVNHKHNGGKHEAHQQSNKPTTALQRHNERKLQIRAIDGEIVG